MNHTFGLYDLISAIADAIGVHDSPATRTRLARIFAEHSARLDATGNRRRRPVFGPYDLLLAVADAIGIHDDPVTRTRLARIFAEHLARLDATGNRRRRPVAVLAHDICVRFRAGEWRD